ncbi:hypothetical protein KI688_010594 [Linnemannia hyalina]|uniref:F-box domain-containing protein n=1 Tax=Linnemannia hyalina TaxID=64524 RepID=A0A9P7XXA5_9FUNG|nr:hypothetical protein KI688_010594 [Linnemannia hyalina]
MPHFTDLPPEVLALIGDLIDTGATKNSLVLASRFCRQHFGHLRWRHLRFTQFTSWRFVKFLEPYAHSVRHVRFESSIYKGFYQVDFPGLVTFQHRFLEKDKKNKVAIGLLEDFISRHRTIRDLTIITLETGMSSRFWEAVSTSLLNPRRLKLDGGLYGGAVKNFMYGPEFWHACSRFEEVIYRGWDQSGSLDLGTVDFSQLKSLDYRAAVTPFPIDATKIWRWMGTCSNLTRLHWRDIISIEQLATVTERPLWPHLEDFSLGYVQESEEDFAAVVLIHLPPLKRLTILMGPIGPVCFGILQERHLDSLQTLSLAGAGTITSRMALDILLQFSHLVVFEAYHIDLRDFRSTPQPWVCQGLKRLRVTFESDPSDPGVDTLLLEQLSKLVHLEELYATHCLSHFGPITGPEATIPSLSWKLDSGLGRLSVLTRLRVFMCKRSGRDLEVEDIEWMMDHWPSLETLTGCFSLDSTVQKNLMALISQRGIHASSFNLFI